MSRSGVAVQYISIQANICKVIYNLSWISINGYQVLVQQVQTFLCYSVKRPVMLGPWWVLTGLGMRSISATLPHLFLSMTCCRPPQAVIALDRAAMSSSIPPTCQSSGLWIPEVKSYAVSIWRLNNASADWRFIEHSYLTKKSPEKNLWTCRTN